ncbi:MAG: (2Fe-2S) ferredoxin domain-containing protein [Bdellovibrionaceae bacterium]|nr:(2Fe-2S) ferredoxin domain-containing protein [Bdellovibrio sp.]
MKKYSIPWEVGSLFICTKCGAKFNENDLAEDIKKTLRKELKEVDAHKKIRVMTSGCLNVCYPEELTFTFMPNNGETEVYTTSLKEKEATDEIRKFLKKKI